MLRIARHLIAAGTVGLIVGSSGGCSERRLNLLGENHLRTGEELILNTDHTFELKAAVTSAGAAPATKTSPHGRWRTIARDLPIIELTPGGMFQFAVHDAGPSSVERIETYDPHAVSPADRPFILALPDHRLIFLPELIPGLGGLPGFVTAAVLRGEDLKTPPSAPGGYEILAKVSSQRWEDGKNFWATMTAGDALMLYRYEPLSSEFDLTPATPEAAHPERIPFSDIVIVRRGKTFEPTAGINFSAHGQHMVLVAWKRPGDRTPEEDAELGVVRQSLIAALQQ
jgi:hypothetical protein